MDDIPETEEFVPPAEQSFETGRYESPDDESSMPGLYTTSVTPDTKTPRENTPSPIFSGNSPMRKIPRIPWGGEDLFQFMYDHFAELLPDRQALRVYIWSSMQCQNMNEFYQVILSQDVQTTKNYSESYPEWEE